MTIDCTTNKPAYYTALSFHREPISLFYLAPNGKKLIQIGQAFTVTNLTEQDAGDYGCIAIDKDLQNSTISKAELIILSRKYFRNRFYHTSCCLTTVGVSVKGGPDGGGWRIENADYKMRMENCG